MSKPQRLKGKTLQEDIDAFAAFQAVRDYRPNNSEFETAAVNAAHAAMIARQTDEVQKNAAAAAAADAAEAAEHAFHQMILGVKDQIKSQFGASSDEYASLGLKKKDEYRPGGRRAAAKTETPI
ncbi:MAG: hypothetical protein JSS81_13860 [Acidobacteria bacterium]|nr:hypothetical protein [Acidobacteriota bacterium]